MKTVLPTYLQEVVVSSQLTGKDREDLEKELLSHYFMATKDLEQKGLKKEELDQQIHDQFGNGKVIALEIKQVHWDLLLTKKIIFYLFLAVTCGPLAFYFFMSGLSIITLIFFIITLLAGAIIYFVLTFISTKKQLRNKPFVTSSIIMSLAVMVHWLMLFFSEKNLPQQDLWYDPMRVGGFPFKDVYYPSAALGNDHVSLANWLGFYSNYAFWLLVIIFIYPLLPSSLKTRKAQMFLVTSASIVSFLACGLFLLKFD